MAGSSGAMSELGGRYASAFFELAQEAGDLARVEAEVKALATSISQSSDLADFLANPVIDRQTQAKTIDALLSAAGADAMLKNLAALMVKNGRLFALPQVLSAFLKLAADARGEVSAEAITAAPLNDDQQRRLRAEIEASVGKAVNLTLSTDADLLGGMIVKVGSRMVDSSLRTKLNRLKLAMKEA